MSAEKGDRKMNLKRVVSVVLSIAILAGLASCTDSKKKTDEELIEDVMSDYEDALKSFDGDDVLKLTNWDDDDKKYEEVEELLDLSRCDKDLHEVYKTIASTISLDFDTDDIRVKDKKATVSFKYKMVNWQGVFYGSSGYNSYDEVVYSLKHSSSNSRIDGKLTFVLEDGEWKISKISNLEQVFEFTYECPDVWTYTYPTDPVTTTTTTTMPDKTTSWMEPSGTDFPDSYEKAVKAYYDVLEMNRDAIMDVENDYDIDPVGLYDIDGNGLPELYFISEEENDYSATLHVYEYGEYRGEAYEVLAVPNVFSVGQASRNFIIYVTDDHLVVTYTYGEDYIFHVESALYYIGPGDNFTSKWNRDARFARVTFTDYDPETGKEITTCLYYLHDYTIDESTYRFQMDDIISRTKIVLGRKFNLSPDDPEYDILYKPSNNMMNYETASEYLNSLM